MNFNKVMLVILAIQLNVIIFYLNKISYENHPVVRFNMLKEFLNPTENK